MIKVGIIGTNFITDWFLEGARRHDQFTFAALYSRKRETAEAFLERHGATGVEIFTDLDAFAASDSFDAAYVASPNVCHAEQTMNLIAGGKHVLCEKPMGVDTLQTEQMTAAARKADVVLMEALKTTLLPNFAAVRDALPQIGTIRRYFAQYCQYSRRYDALKAGTVLNAFNPAMAGGAMLDLGIYTIYPMIALFGEPLSVTGGGEMLWTGVDGQGSALCRYDGFDGVVMFSKIAESWLPSEIQGEDGSILISRINSFERVELLRRDGTRTDLSRPTYPENMYYEFAEFASLIANGSRESAVNSHSASIAAARTMEKILKQIKTQ